MGSHVKSIYFIGKLPPPLGGVTVFNKRKVSRLSHSGHRVIVIEPKLKSLFMFIRCVLDTRADVLISASNRYLFWMIYILGLSKRASFYDHNSSRSFSGFKWADFFFLKKCLVGFKRIVLVSEHLSENYKNFEFYDELNFVVESAFIPPNPKERAGIISTYDMDIVHLLERGERNLVMVGAYQPSLDALGRDIYSLSETLDVFVELSENFRDINFVILVARFTDTEFSRKIEKRIMSICEERDNVFLVSGQKEMWPLFEKGLLYVRPTITDGDSVSVREALYFSCPVLASNVVPRPDGVFLYDPKNETLLSAVEIAILKAFSR